MDTLRSSEPSGRHWPISAYTVLAVNTDPTRTDTSCSICIHCDQVPIPWSWMASSILRPFLSTNHSFTYLITSHQLLLYSSSSPGPHSFNFLQPNFFDVFTLMVLFLTACGIFCIRITILTERRDFLFMTVPYFVLARLRPHALNRRREAG